MILPPLVTRKCACGCPLEFRCFPTSNQLFSSILCEDKFNNINSSDWKVRHTKAQKSQKRERDLRLRQMIGGSTKSFHIDLPANKEELRKMVGI